MRWSLLAVVVGMYFVSVVWAYDWSTNPGDGSAGNPYQISTAEQMNSIGTNATLRTKCFILTNNIGMSAYTGTQYKIIYGFSGTFDGNGFTISNLTYTTASEASNIGLFGSIDNASIQNLRMENINISSQGDYVGGLIGSMNDGQVINCSVTGNIAGHTYVGGLVGSQAFSDGTITNCFCQGTVTGYTHVGGLVGEQWGEIYRSYNKSTVTGTGTDYASNFFGGISGFMMVGSIKDCYNTGNISGYSMVGGITGYGSMENCYNTGSISGYLQTGGLSGRDIGTINSYWDVETSGISSSGGGKGRTTEQMKQSMTYIGWNHEEPVWILAEGEDYPHLAWEGVAGEYLPTHDLTEYVWGNGEEWDPYRISTAEQLNLVGLFPDEWGKNFVLENDIDLSSIAGTGFNKIGTALAAFSGTFDGQGYTISNFSYTTGNELFMGLFGYAYDVTIKNINLRDINISSTGGGIGGLVGAIEGSNSSIENCSVTGQIAGGSYMGGLIGGSSATVRDCYSDCCISGQTVVGGLVGSAYGNISNCYSSGNVTAVGDAVEELVNGQAGQMAGGLVGLQGDGLIYISFSNATVSGRSMLGGLVGAQAQKWDFDYNHPMISNCYSTGDVAGGDDSIYVGGLVGYQYIENGIAAVINGYSAGHITAGNNSNYVGGFIGYCGEAVFNSFWDVEASGLTEGAGGGLNVEITGKTTAEMKKRSTFTSAGWDFWGMPQNETDTIWAMEPDTNEGYPYLTSRQGFGTPENPYQISSAEELIVLSKNSSLWDKHFILVNDIDMSNEPNSGCIIGNQFEPFMGTFDGQEHKISNLTYLAPEYPDTVGLFGVAQDAIIKNLGVENVHFAGNNSGGLVGNQYGGTIINCYSTGVIDAWTGGGLVGIQSGGTIANSYSVSTVNSIWGGGLVGWQYDGVITRCYSIGYVTSVSSPDSYIGGLIGNQESGNIRDCYSMASIHLNTTEFPVFAGGLAGISRGSITNCYSTGAVAGNTDPNYYGGLIGYGDNNVSNSYWDIQSSGLNHSFGGIGKTTAEMKTLATFTNAGWDFTNEMINRTNDIWRMCADGVDYPRLNWESGSGDFACPDGVSLEDLGVFTERWLMDDCSAGNNYCGGVDIDASGAVNLADYSIFAQHWLEGI